MIKDPNCQNKNYTVPELDEAVIAEIKKLAIDASFIEQAQDAKPVNDAAEKAKAITAEIEKVDAQISKIMDLYALGHFDLNMINEKVADFNKTKLALQKELESLNASTSDEEKLSVEQIQSIAQLWNEDLTLEQKRSIVQSLIFYIEIDNDNVLIHWKF